MNDTTSLLLATSILATGGVCLYMYKSLDDNEREDKNNSDNDSDDDYENDYGKDYNDEDDNNNDNNDDNDFFGLRSFFGSDEDSKSKKYAHDDEYDEEVKKVKSRPKQKGGNSKTKRNKKNGGTKRRY